MARALKMVLLLVLFSAGTCLPGNDEIQFSHLTTEDGLSLNIVTKILQDSRGFMWFGTYNGLNRYDGYNFKKYYPNEKEPNSISSHSIWSLSEDNKGFIWIGTLDGLNRYDWRTETFKVYKNIPSDQNSISNGYVFSVFQDSKGRIWIGTLNGLNLYNPDKDNFTVYRKVSDVLNVNNLNAVTCIEEDSKGNIWFGTWKGLTCLTPDGRLTYKTLPRNNDNILYNDITSILEDSKKNLWIGTSTDGLFRYDRDNDRFLCYPNNIKDNSSLSDNSVISLFEDSHNNLWIGTRKGLNRYIPGEDNFQRILNNPDKPLSISSDEVYSVTEDASGILWLGTSEGLNKYYYCDNQFRFITAAGSNGEKLSNGHVNSVAEDKYHNLWVGTKAGLNRIDSKTGKIKSYYYDERGKGILKKQYIWSVFADHAGLIWIGTDMDGLHCFDPRADSHKIYRYNDTSVRSLSNNGVITICEDKKGNIWAGTWWGLNLLNRETGDFTRFNNFYNASIWSLLCDSKGNIWVGTDGCGAFKYNPDKKTFTNYFYDDTLKHSKSNSGRISSIFEDREGTLWFATMDGLRSYDVNTGKTLYYWGKDWLPSNLVNSISQDKNGFLWITTDRGLVKFDKRKQVFTNFSKRNGLIDLEFSPRAAAVTAEGVIVLGGKKGLTIFNPDSIIDLPLSASVVFTDLKISNEPVLVSNTSVLKKSISYARNIVLSYDSDIITIEFALLDYFNTKNNRFIYKLAGLDSGWNDIGSRNFVTFTNLPPGEYKLLVKAFNNGITGSKKQAQLKIIVTPAFYDTTWFRLLLIFAAFLLVSVFSQLRMARVTKTNKMLEQKVAEHTKDLDKTITELYQEIYERKKAEAKVQTSLEEKEVLLKEIHHRVKNNLQVISSLLYLQSVKAKDKETLSLFEDSQSRIKSMALIHERLYQSADFAQVNFGDYVHELLEHLSRSFKKSNIQIQTKINIKEIKLSLDSAIPCALIVNELFTNAYKYAFPTEWIQAQTASPDYFIEVTVVKGEANEYVLSVKDNGIGIPEGINIKTTNSLGLKLVNSMVKQLDGTMDIVRKNGTSYYIKFFEG